MTGTSDDRLEKLLFDRNCACFLSDSIDQLAPNRDVDEPTEVIRRRLATHVASENPGQNFMNGATDFTHISH